MANEDKKKPVPPVHLPAHSVAALRHAECPSPAVIDRTRADRPGPSVQHSSMSWRIITMG